jgi:hypothetical protein
MTLKIAHYTNIHVMVVTFETNEGNKNNNFFITFVVSVPHLHPYISKRMEKFNITAK